MHCKNVALFHLPFIAAALQLALSEPDITWPSAQLKLDNITYIGQAKSILSVSNGSKSKHVNVYSGIPYAVAPRRFSFPEPFRPSPAPIQKDATARPPACIQAKPSNPNVPESEDCLTVNLFIPAEKQPESPSEIQKDGLPIMIFLYGGGFQNGDASSDLYDATSLAATQDVIVAVPNYRVNIFGFPGWTTIDRGNESLNLGLHDQREAMRFLSRHARALGGDPAKITLFGQSAGARSADFHILTMGLSRGRKEDLPFRAVIMQSGSAELIPLADRRRAGPLWSNVSQPPFLELADLVGCSVGSSDKDVFNCMREVPVERLKDNIVDHQLYFPLIEDNFLTTVADEKFEREFHPFNKVPILMGTNSNEASTLIHGQPPIDIEKYIDEVMRAVNAPDEEIIERKKQFQKAFGRPFPNEIFNSSVEAMTMIETELAYTCLTSREAKASAKGGRSEFGSTQRQGAPTWRYLFNATFPSTDQFPGSGSYHGVEIRFIFGSLRNSSGKLTDEELRLSHFMQKTWADFAKDPERALLWPKVGSSEDDLGVINKDAQIRAMNSSVFDRNCHLYEPFYSGRA